MKPYLLTRSLLGIAILSACCFIQSSFSQERIRGKLIKTGMWNGQEIEFVEGEIAVKIAPETTSAQISSLLLNTQATVRRQFDFLGWGFLELPPGKDEMDAIREIQKLPYVIAVEPNMVGRIQLEPNDPYFKGTSPATYAHQWALKNTGQNPPGGTNDADIDAPEAWGFTTGSSNVIVAVLDTGIPMLNGALSHPDLDDPNKIILGSDFVDPGQANGVQDEHGHGTHVAGIIGAESNNGIGISGVAWNSKLMIIQAASGTGAALPEDFEEAVIEAVNYQINNPGKRVVINYSAGGGHSTVREDAVDYANDYGVPIVAAAGNYCGLDVACPAHHSASYSNVIAVAATNHHDVRSEYSDVGSSLTLSAPGGHGTTGYCQGVGAYYNSDDILSTTPNYAFNWQNSHSEIGTSYGYAAGTSFAAPHVAGTVALMLSVNPSLTPLQIRKTLELSADKVAGMGGQNFTNYYGYGRLNANKAVRNLYVPQVYSTISSALSTAISGQTVVVSGQHTVSSNLTVNSGVTLQCEADASIAFTSGKSLTVNGTLIAIGDESRPTFTRSGTSGTWGGIVVNSGGSVNIQRSNISYAGTGIHLNGTSLAQTIKYCIISNITNYGIQVSNSSSGSKDISYNTISNVSTGIYLNNATATLHQNKISTSIAGSGIYSYGGSGYSSLSNNILSGTYAVYATNYSTLYLLRTSPWTSGHNETMVGSVTLLAENNSTIEAGGYSSIQGKNSFYGGGIDAQAVALNSSTIVARYNWWNGDESYIESSGGTVDMSNPLGSDPNGGWSGKIAPSIVATSSTKTDNLTAQATSVSESSPLFDETLEAARNSMAAGDYNEAIRLFTEKVKSNDDLKRKKYALARLAECYAQAERSDFIDFLNNEVRPDRAATDELYVSSLELEGIALIGAQRYTDAAAVYEGIKSNYPDRSETYKHALFNLAKLYHNQLGDNAKANTYAEELKSKYPDDALTEHARILIGETSQSASEENLASEENENTQEQGIALESYPNPFNPSTQIRYSIIDAGYVSLKVYDLLGREVAVLVSEERQPGAYSVEWNAGSLPSGMYFSRLESGGRAIIQKLLLVR